MKKKNMVNFRKIGNMAVALMLSVVLASGKCASVRAASDSGTVNGATCSATLTVNSSATANTTSSLAAYHHASVSFYHYYTDGNGEAKSGTATAQSNNSCSVSATANGLGTNVRNILTTSHHSVTDGSYTWSTNLKE